ncbi:Carboxylesterase patB [Fusarium oxysporum f. sp. albedinis]|nr:Carboxylesterase patB [Fusarium oxysporum f. sp. albedinis]
MSNPVPSVLVDAVERSVSKDMILKSTPSADSYCLAPEFEALPDDLQNAGVIEKNKRLYYISRAAHPKQQRDNEIMMAHHFRQHEIPDIAGTTPELDPKLHACRIKANPHPYLSIKHSIIRDFIFDANGNIRNNVESLFLRRECKPRYRYNFNELEADMFYDWEWLRFLQRRNALAGDIESRSHLCAALWPSIVFERLKSNFREIERSGFRVLAWQLCNVDGVVPLWLDRHGFWISGVPVHKA